MAKNITWDFDVKISGSLGITLVRIFVAEWPTPVPILLVTVIMTVADQRKSVNARLDLGKRAFIDPVYSDLANGVIDDAATKHLHAQAETITGIVCRLFAVSQQPN